MGKTGSLLSKLQDPGFQVASPLLQLRLELLPPAPQGTVIGQGRRLNELAAIQ